MMGLNGIKIAYKWWHFELHVIFDLEVEVIHARKQSADGPVHVVIVYDDWSELIERIFIQDLVSADITHPTEEAT